MWLNNAIQKLILLSSENNLIMRQATYPFVFGALGACTVFLFRAYFFPIVTIGTVNVTSLVDQFIQQEAKQNISPVQLKEHIHTFSQQLEEAVQFISDKKHVVLVPREAVLAGSKDYTALVTLQMSSVRVGDK